MLQGTRVQELGIPSHRPGLVRRPTHRMVGAAPPHRLIPAADRMLDSSLTVIPDAGHFLTDEQPDQILGLVDDLRMRTGYAE